MTPTFIIQDFTYLKEINELRSTASQLGLNPTEIPFQFEIIGKTGTKIMFGDRDMLRDAVTYDPIFIYYVLNEYWRHKFVLERGLKLTAVIKI